MVTYKKLHKFPIAARYKDQYPANIYELDGYVSYSWGENVPKRREVMDLSKLSLCWNNYYGILELHCDGFTGAGYNREDFEEINIEGSVIKIKAKTGAYDFILIKESEETGEEDITIHYPVIIASNIDRIDYIDINNYVEKITRLNQILEQFKSSPERQTVSHKSDDIPQYKYIPGISYNYAREHQP